MRRSGRPGCSLRCAAGLPGFRRSGRPPMAGGSLPPHRGSGHAAHSAVPGFRCRRWRSLYTAASGRAMDSCGRRENPQPTHGTVSRRSGASPDWLSPALSNISRGEPIIPSPVRRICNPAVQALYRCYRVSHVGVPRGRPPERGRGPAAAVCSPLKGDCADRRGGHALPRRERSRRGSGRPPGRRGGTVGGLRRQPPSDHVLSRPSLAPSTR